MILLKIKLTHISLISRQADGLAAHNMVLYSIHTAGVGCLSFSVAQQVKPSIYILRQMEEFNIL